jgi:hypothetical protein
MTTKTKKKKLVIEWPETAFTINDIKDKYPDAKEITLRFRINKAISDGDIAYIGKIPQKVGRPHIVFARTPLDQSVINTAEKEIGLVVDDQVSQQVVDVAKVDSTETTKTTTTKHMVKQTV